jgi:acyl-CoA synthetase (AMP-forming)/AMP-acid ligase II
MQRNGLALVESLCGCLFAGLVVVPITGSGNRQLANAI